MRLIDADALIYTKAFAPCGNGKYDAVNIVYETDIDAAPTIDPVKHGVRHGYWELVDGTEPRRYGCSECKRLSYTQDNYCSYCGALMDGEEDDNKKRVFEVGGKNGANKA